jgi:hypothetical protein
MWYASRPHRTGFFVRRHSVSARSQLPAATAHKYTSDARSTLRTERLGCLDSPKPPPPPNLEVKSCSPGLEVVARVSLSAAFSSRRWKASLKPGRREERKGTTSSLQGRWREEEGRRCSDQVMGARLHVGRAWLHGCMRAWMRGCVRDDMLSACMRDDMLGV